MIKLNTSLDIVAVPSAAIAPSDPPLPPDMANATFNGDGAVASPPARDLVRVVDDDGWIFLLPPPHLLMEGDEDIGAMAKASALTNVAIARNAAAALLSLMVGQRQGGR